MIWWRAVPLVWLLSCSDLTADMPPIGEGGTGSEPVHVESGAIEEEAGAEGGWTLDATATPVEPMGIDAADAFVATIPVDTVGSCEPGSSSDGQTFVYEHCFSEAELSAFDCTHALTQTNTAPNHWSSEIFISENQMAGTVFAFVYTEQGVSRVFLCDSDVDLQWSCSSVILSECSDYGIDGLGMGFGCDRMPVYVLGPVPTATIICAR